MIRQATKLQNFTVAWNILIRFLATFKMMRNKSLFLGYKASSNTFCAYFEGHLLIQIVQTTPDKFNYTDKHFEQKAMIFTPA